MVVACLIHVRHTISLTFLIEKQNVQKRLCKICTNKSLQQWIRSDTNKLTKSAVCFLHLVCQLFVTFVQYHNVKLNTFLNRKIRVKQNIRTWLAVIRQAVAKELSRILKTWLVFHSVVIWPNPCLQLACSYWSRYLLISALWHHLM